jgi:hypothetical protein
VDNWQTFLRASAQTADNLQRNIFFVCGNPSLVITLFRLIQGYLGAPYRVASQAAAQLAHPLDQKCIEIPFGFTRGIFKNHKNYKKKCTGYIINVLLLLTFTGNVLCITCI